MWKQYIKQALYQLKENRLISIVCMVGTALAICMIMVIVLTLQIRIKDCVPEVNRSRSLYVKAMTSRHKEQHNNAASSQMSVTTARECFKTLTIPEAVTITSVNNKMRASLPGGGRMSVDEMETDEAFWQVFCFEFLCGKPYTKADFESGLSKVVVSASVARHLFGTTDVVGRTIQLNKADYTITGVVKDVSKLATASYAQVWIPYTSTDLASFSWRENLMGPMRAVILARSSDDFPAIRAEVEKYRQVYNSKLKDMELIYRGQPDTQFAYLYRHWGTDLDMKHIVRRFILIIVILLLVPAINLSSMTLSRMRKRMTEIGVRKAFGATANELFRQVFWENLILTLLAGVLGLILSYSATFLLNSFLFDNSENAGLAGETSLSTDMLFSPLTFLVAFCFCLLLNLLSAGIPAWRVSRMNIVDAINQR